MLKVKCFTLGELGANCFFVIDEESKDAFVVDPGDESPALEAAIDSHGADKLRYILLTHGHFDHIGGAASLKVRYPEAKIVIGEGDKYFPQNELLNLGLHFDLEVDPFRCDILVNDGDKLPFGSGEIEVLITPGHTRGSACFIADGAIFTGDTLITGTTGRTDFPTGSYEDMVKSIARLAAIPEDLTVYCGHGGGSTLDRERATNYFMRMTK